MVNYYRRSLSARVDKLEQQVSPKNNPVLFVTLDKNGKYGNLKLTKQELDEYVKEKGFEQVFIDDISIN